jgi:predicted porin
MKFKTTAIAMAVAGTIAAPAAVQAGADEIYANARIGIWAHKDEGDNNTQVRSFNSRFGAKGETDLGNGLTSFGHFEWNMDMNNNSGSISKRHLYVGLKGDFGSVLVGQTYQTFYNFVVGPNDIPWWHSGYAMVNYRSRTPNAVTYAGSAGDFNFGATGYFRDDSSDHTPDQAEFGASMAIGDMTLGAAVQWTAKNTDQGSSDNDDLIGGVSLTGIKLGMVGLGLGAQMQDKDYSALAQVDIGNAYIHGEYLFVDKDSGSATLDADLDPAGPGPDDRDDYSLTLGYTQSLGRKTTMWYEVNYTDRDTQNTKQNHTAIMAVLKYDII